MSKKLQTILIFVLAVSVAGSFAVAVKAGFNEQINYQGKLSNSSGMAVADGNYCMKFSIYDNSTGGNLKWSETWDNNNGKVATTSGLFSILLGSHTAFTDIFNSSSLWLEIALDPSCLGSYSQVFSPRKQLGSVPSAFQSDFLQGQTWAIPGAIGSTTPNTGAFTTLSADTNTFYVDATSHRVGIGTTSPSVPFEVWANVAGNGEVMRFYNQANSGSTYIGLKNGTYETQLETNNSSSGPFRYGTYVDTNFINTYTGSGAYGSLNFVTGGTIRLNIVGGTGSTAGNVGIGTTSPSKLLSVGASNQFTVDSSGNVIANKYSVSSGTSSQFLKADGSVDSGTYYKSGDSPSFANITLSGGINSVPIGLGGGAVSTNAAIGSGALNSNTTGVNNLALGSQSLYANQTGNSNVGLGTNSLYNNISGGGNLALGYYSLYRNNGGSNTGIGAYSLQSNTSGAANIGIGYDVLDANSVGWYNTAIGYQAGANNNNDSNIFLGSYAGFYETGTSKLFIDNQKRASEADARQKALIYGVFNADPASQTLALNASVTANSLTTTGTGTFGSFKLGSSTTAGYVLTADANGNGTWQAAPGGAGSLLADGTVAGATSQSQDFTNGINVGSSGQLTVGSSGNLLTTGTFSDQYTTSSSVNTASIFSLINQKNSTPISTNTNISTTASWQPVLGTSLSRSGGVFYGKQGVVSLILNSSEPYNYTMSTGAVSRNQITVTGSSGSTGVAKITGAYNYYAASPSLGNANSQIGTIYAFYDQGQNTAGSGTITNAWGLGINTQSYINASLSVGKNTAPGTTLDVNGTGTFANIIDSGLTASRMVFTDANKQLITPSLGTSAQFLKADGSVDSSTYASSSYVQSRGQNLVTNGSGLMQSNYNFSGLTFDQVYLYSGLGSFRKSTKNSSGGSDELIPIDPSQNYQLSGWAMSGEAGGADYDPNATQYLGITPYDADGNMIFPNNYMKYTGSTDTTLTADLINGVSTTMSVNDATGWDNGGQGYQRNISWWPYTNAKGYTYPDYTYTRYDSENYSDYNSNGLWAAGGVSGNTITLRGTWQGPTLTAGTKIRNSTDGGTYKYVAAGGASVPNYWKYYSGMIGGYDTAGTGSTNLFPYGTAFIKLLFLFNYNQNDSSPVNNVRWSNLQFGLAQPTLAVNGGLNGINSLILNSSGTPAATSGVIYNNGTDIWAYVNNKWNNMTNSSSLRFKHDVQPLADDWTKILQVEPKSFLYNNQPDNTLNIGYIAEDFDSLGLKNLVQYDSQNRPSGINYDKIALYDTEIIKQQQKDIDLLKAINGLSLDGEGATGSGSVGNGSSLLDAASALLSYVGVSISNGITNITTLATKNFASDRAIITTADVQRMEMVDQINGDVYCTWIANGEWQKAKGSCNSVAPAVFDSTRVKKISSQEELAVNSTPSVNATNPSNGQSIQSVLSSPDIGSNTTPLIDSPLQSGSITETTTPSVGDLINNSVSSLLDGAWKELAQFLEWIKNLSHLQSFFKNI